MLKELFDKRKYFQIIALITLIFALSAVLVYGVVLFRSYVVGNGNIDTGNLPENGVSVSISNVVNENIAFTHSGEKINIPVTLSNTSAGAMHYYYTLSKSSETTSQGNSISSAILVYYDGEYLGTLAEICAGTGKIDVNNYVPATSSDEHQFTFELHIDAPESAYGNANVTVQITCYAETIDYKQIMFVKDETEFKKAVDDVNSGLLLPEVKIILSQSVTLTQSYEIKFPCVLDLYGNELSLNGNTLTLSADGTVKLISSKAINYTALSSATGRIVLNASGLLFDVEDFYSSQTVNGEKINIGALYGALVDTSAASFDMEAAVALVMSRLDDNIGEGIRSGETLSLFGALSFYKEQLNVATSGITYNAGTGILAASAEDVTQVVSVTVGGTLKEFKIIGAGEYPLNEEIDELKHIPNIQDGVIPSVTSDLFLPKSLKNKGATVKWTSSDPETISDDGKISDTVKDNTEINMYAEIRINDKIFTRVFTFKVSSQNNETKFNYIVAQISPITLQNVYTGANEANSHLYLPVVDSNSAYDYRKTYSTPSGSPTLNWSPYKDVKLEWIHYSVSNTYNYISLTNLWSDVKTGDEWSIDTRVQNCAVYLNTAVFFTYAQIDVIGKFENDDKIYEGKINVIIKLGDNTELQEIVFDHISGELTTINVLDNIIKTRKAGGMNTEKGDFYLESEYKTYDITYSVPASSAGIISSITEETVAGDDGVDVQKYKIGINADGFYSADTDIGINVTLTLKPAYQTGTGATAASRTKVLYFNVPGALHPDDSGFSNFSVFNSVKYQVFQQLPADEKVTQTGFGIANGVLTNTTGKYILIYDIERADCKKLSFPLSDANADTDNNAAHELMSLLAWAIGNEKVPASSVINASGTTNYSLTYNNSAPLPTDAEITTLSPANQTASGSYLYYNTTDGKWQYYSFTVGTSATYTLTFNCLRISKNGDYMYDNNTNLQYSTTITDASNFVFLTEEEFAFFNNPTENRTLGATAASFDPTKSYYIYCPSTGRYIGSSAGSRSEAVTPSTTPVLYKIYAGFGTYAGAYAFYSTDNTAPVQYSEDCMALNHGNGVVKFPIFNVDTEVLRTNSFWTVSESPTKPNQDKEGTTGSVSNVYDVYGAINGGTPSVFTPNTNTLQRVEIDIWNSTETVTDLSSTLAVLSDGKDYLTDSEVSVIKSYYQNATGCSDAEWNTLWATIAERAVGYVITDGATLNATMSSIIKNHAGQFRESDDFAYFKYVEVMQWATNEKDYGATSLPSGADAGSSPNLGVIMSRYGNTYNTGYTEDNSEYISEKEKAVLIAYWYGIPTTHSTTVDVWCGDAFSAAFNANTTIPTYLNYNGANLLVRALYTALDANHTINLSAFRSGYSEYDGIVCPVITGADDSFTGLSHFINLESFRIYEDTETGLPAFLTTTSLSNFCNRLTTNNAAMLNTLVMQHCASGYVEFDLSQLPLLTHMTYLDLKNNTGINNIGDLLGLNLGALTYLDVRNATVEDEYKIYVLQNINSAGAGKTIHYTSDGGKVCTQTDLGNASALPALMYLKEIGRINSIYLQLAKKLVIDSSSTPLQILWRVEKGNMMHEAPVTAAGNQKYSNVATVADMQALCKNYYYCTTDFTYNGQNFTAGKVYKISYTGGNLTFTENALSVSATAPATSAMGGAPSGTQTSTYQRDNVTPSYIRTESTTTTGSGFIYSSNTRVYSYYVNSRGTSTRQSRVRTIGYTGSTTYTYTHTYTATGRNISVYENKKEHYYLNGDGNIVKSEYEYSVTHDASYQYIVTETNKETTYTGVYTATTQGATSGTVINTNNYIGIQYGNVFNATSAIFYFSPQETTAPAFSETGGNWTTGDNIISSGWNVISTSNYISPVGTLASSADATALETFADALPYDGNNYYHYTGTTGTGYFYNETTDSHVAQTYINDNYYLLSLGANGYSLAQTTLTTTTATNMEAILDEANTHVSDAQYGNYYGKYYYYTGTNNATVNGHTYVSGNVYRLLESGGEFYFANDFGVANNAEVNTITSAANMNGVLAGASVSDINKLYNYSGETATVNGKTYVMGNLYRLAQDRYGYYYFTTEIGLRNTAETITTIAELQTRALNATAGDIGKIYWYTGAENPPENGVVYRNARTYEADTFYEMSRNEKTGTYYLKHLGALGTTLNTTAVTTPSRLSNERYYAAGGSLYGGTGGTEQTVITAIVKQNGITYMRKFAVPVIG